MATTLPRRDEIPLEYTWDLQSIFASDADWAAELQAIEQAYPVLATYAGHLGDSPAVLLEAITNFEGLLIRLLKVYVYANLKHDSDTNNQEAAGQVGRCSALYGQLSAATAYLNPELVLLGMQRLEAFIQAEPRLATYRFYFQETLRRQAHVRSSEVEEVLALSTDALNTPATAFGMLSDADLRFPHVPGADGQDVTLAQGNIHALLSSTDRAVRQAAWQAYADGYLSVKNTMAALLAGSVKAAVFNARVRHYGSTLEAALDQSNVPVVVYHNTLDTCRRYLPIWHRYWKARRRGLRVETLAPWDVFAPLRAAPPQVPYRQAVEYVLAGMAPLGPEYLEPLRAGLLEQRWVDVYPNQGKRSNAYSAGTYGTHPFLLLNHTDDMTGMSVLAHELGHSMHTYMSTKHQPFVYANYTSFVAEVASNFNQAMVRAHLLSTSADPQFQLAVIEEALYNFHRYFFMMPTLARFELDIHQRVERGAPLTADILNGLMADLFAEAYGSVMQIDRERVGITWAQFPHLYANFYVYEYASGIAAANALSDRVLSGEPGAAEQYLRFLKAGSSCPPLEALQIAGIDMTSPEPIERAFAVLERFVERFEALTQ